MENDISTLLKSRYLNNNSMGPSDQLEDSNPSSDSTLHAILDVSSFGQLLRAKQGETCRMTVFVGLL